MSKKITDKVSWVGKIDWELRKFHGEELSTFKGSSYNAYLIRDEKNVLIDTVWGPYDREFVSRLKEEIDLDEIDYIVMNHSENDHSEALRALMKEIPDTPIYCTKKGEGILRGLHHQDWNYVNVKSGDELNIGESTLHFIEAPMLHWPDTMFTYMTGDNILFSTDAFGQHYASEMLYDEKEDLELVMYEAEKYYANIIKPFNPMVRKKLAEIKGMNLDIDLICPSHGICWKNNIDTILAAYDEWSKDDFAYDRISILYDSMWTSTRHMAEAIAQGIHDVSPDTEIKVHNVARTDKNNIITEVFTSKAVLLGSPTINNGYSYAVAGILEMIRAMKFKNKKAAAFGSFGWSGEASSLISEELEKSGFEIIAEPLKVKWSPDEETLKEIREYGREFAKKTLNCNTTKKLSLVSRI